MSRQPSPSTLGELKSSGYTPKSVREELHCNLVRKIESGEPLFSGIIGYRDTVIPEIENALLAGQNIIILGERGQAKSRIVRSMTDLLDAEIPIVAGSDINDDPFSPVSAYARGTVAEKGDATPIAWLPRSSRYGEKLATPDVSMADLIGDVDPIKVAEGRYLADEFTIHYGLIPRSNRGIFCVNELPDLPERIQVGLFNLMEERDIQIKGYRVRLPLDILVFATANPEDYTNRGRIITPLKDRFGAQVRTHYPQTPSDEIAIVEQERKRFGGAGQRATFPTYMAEVVAEISALARRSPEVNQRSGVSVRVSISNYETLAAAALGRSLRLKEDSAAPRVTDLPALAASMRGKIELESVEDGREAAVVEELTKRAVASVFGRRFDGADFDAIALAFEEGVAITAGATVPSADYVRARDTLKGLRSAVAVLAPQTPAETASAVEFVLEGLHLHRRLNRTRIGGGFSYVRPPPPPVTPQDQGGGQHGGGRERRRERRRDENS
jgi:magnesium chelatase subunit I